MTDPSPESLEALRLKLDAARRSAPERYRMALRKQHVRWTTDSNAIEGSTLSFSETLFFLEHGLTVEGKPLKDFLDARNHAEAIRLVEEIITSACPITPGVLKELNALLLLGVEGVTGGQWKTRPNHVIRLDGTLHTYLDPIHVPAAIERLCAAMARPDAAPLDAAVAAHHDFTRIHPFEDGNGRLARLLMNFVLMRAGFPPAVIPQTARRAYIAALQAADEGDRYPLHTLVADSLRATLSEMLADMTAPE
jgi:Fic family protein